jgi:hypothetical protein
MLRQERSTPHHHQSIRKLDKDLVRPMFDPVARTEHSHLSRHHRVSSDL